MVGLLLIVAVKTKHLPFVRDKRTSYVRTALWGLLVRIIRNFSLIISVLF